MNVDDKIGFITDFDVDGTTGFGSLKKENERYIFTLHISTDSQELAEELEKELVRLERMKPCME